MTPEKFKLAVAEGIPDELPIAKPRDLSLNHAPKRKAILSAAEKNWPSGMRFAMFLPGIMQ